MLKVIKRFNIYYVVVIIGFLVATALYLAIPAHMNEPDDWAYYYAGKNFSQGKLVIDDFLLFQEGRQAWQQGGLLIQYLRIGFNKWVLEKPPGYVFFLVPLELMGIPRWGNVLLALGMTIVTYILLKRLRNEKAACIGSLLMLFTPASLIMLNRSFADAFAAKADILTFRALAIAPTYYDVVKFGLLLKFIIDKIASIFRIGIEEVASWTFVLSVKESKTILLSFVCKFLFTSPH